MPNPIKTVAAYTWDTFSFGPARRSTVRTVTASANRLTDLFKQTRDTVGQRQTAIRHETFQQAVERLQIDKSQIRHVHQAMTRMQRSAIVAFGVVLLVLSVWLGSVWAKPTIGNLISSIVSFALLVNCYVSSMRYGLRRYQIERQNLCSLRDYLREAGYIHPLLW